MTGQLSRKEFLTEVVPAAGTVALFGIWLLTAPNEALEAIGLDRSAGRYFTLAAAVLFAWGFVSLFVSSLAQPIRWTWGFFRSLVVWALRLLVKAYSAALGFLLRPAIMHALGRGVSSVSVPFDWKADKVRLYPRAQAADFKSFVEPGMRVRSISFRISPDFRHDTWRAGFRLGPAREDLERTQIRGTFLFHVFSAPGQQPQIICHLNERAVSQSALAHRKPSYCVNASIFPSDGSTSHISISVDDEGFVSESMPSNYAEKVTLLAWAGARDFTVYFDSVTLRWLRC